MNKEALVEIRAPGVDTAAVMREIMETVERKAADGVYNDTRIAKAERANLINLRDDKDFLDFYLAALREAAIVDINDYEIRERRATLAPLLVRLKKTIWGLLKFYTYRMWSQQNSINGLVVTGLEGMHERYQKQINQLEKRIAELEKKSGNRS